MILQARSARWLGGLLAFAPLVLAAAEPIPLPKPPSPFVSAGSDRILSLNVTAALANDPELAHLPVLVDVFNKVVLLGGAVPDAETKAKVEAVARKVAGIRDVKNGCWIRLPEDPFRQMVFDRLDGVPPLSKVEQQPEPPSLLLALPEPRLGIPEKLAVVPVLPLPPNRPAPSDRRPNGTVTVNRMTLPLSSRLEDPIGPGGVDVSELPMPTATRSPLPSSSTIPAMNLPTKPIRIEDEIRQIQQSQPRWKPLSWQVTGDRVRLSGSGPHPGDIWAFADAIRNVPTIDRIIVSSR